MSRISSAATIKPEDLDQAVEAALADAIIIQIEAQEKAHLGMEHQQSAWTGIGLSADGQPAPRCEEHQDIEE